jgi:hypothetical protein
MRLVPERRQHLRILTLKNAVWLLCALIVLFMAFSTWNELRTGDSSRERLYERGAAEARDTEPAQTKPLEPISDETFSSGRGGNPLVPPRPIPTPPPPAAEPAPAVQRTLKERRQRGERTVITGGAEGVRVETTTAPPAETLTATETTTAPPPRR